MPILNFILMLVSGFIASKYFFADKDMEFLEEAGLIIFFSITTIPFININLALLNGNYITDNLTFIVSISSISLFLTLLFFANRKNKLNLKEKQHFSISKKDLLVLSILALIIVLLFFYYSNSEFILSLASYLIKGDSECFYMQSFRTVGILNPSLDKETLLNKTYEIICTPGNILFTSTFIPILKMYSFKIIYLFFIAIFFIFTYLIVKKLIANKVIPLMVAIFAVLNPYILSVEVLDRNIITLAISALLFYVVMEYEDKIFLHGLIFGILAGTGLRFLSLVFFVPIFIFYWQKNKRIKTYLIFLASFIITFTFNIPHIYFQGFHSLGEKTSSLSLIIDAFTKWKRTPFLPFPNIVFYLINVINYFGYIIFAIILLGGVNLFKFNKKGLFILLYIFFLTLFILSYQRNWVEGDKYRIIIEAFLPLYILLGYGLKSLFIKKHLVRTYGLFTALLLLQFIFVHIVSAVNFRQDTELYERKQLYQIEEKSYLALIKDSLLTIGFFPNYNRLFVKRDIKRKKIEEKLTFEQVFPKGNLPNYQKYRGFYLAWDKYLFRNKLEQLSKGKNSSLKDYIYLKIDFNKLATDLRNAVEVVNEPDLVAMDLEKKDELFDVYYADLKVDWQKNNLPVCIMLNSGSLTYLKELSIELNAFISFGKDEDGFDIVNSINFKSNLQLAQTGYQTGMKSFPLYEETNNMIFRVPKDIKIIIKNWFINGENGIPYKLDSWYITQDKKGNHKTEFFYNEPESYL